MNKKKVAAKNRIAKNLAIKCCPKETMETMGKREKMKGMMEGLVSRSK